MLRALASGIVGVALASVGLDALPQNPKPRFDPTKVVLTTADRTTPALEALTPAQRYHSLLFRE